MGAPCRNRKTSGTAGSKEDPTKELHPRPPLPSFSASCFALGQGRQGVSPAPTPHAVNEHHTTQQLLPPGTNGCPQTGTVSATACRSKTTSHTRWDPSQPATHRQPLSSNAPTGSTTSLLLVTTCETWLSKHVLANSCSTWHSEHVLINCLQHKAR